MSGFSGKSLCSATITQSAGVPSMAHSRSPIAWQTIGCRSVSDCAAPLCSRLGATMLTVANWQTPPPARAIPALRNHHHWSKGHVSSARKKLHVHEQLLSSTKDTRLSSLRQSHHAYRFQIKIE